MIAASMTDTYCLGWCVDPSTDCDVGQDMAAVGSAAYG